ncbi:putative 3-hydroxyisobutyrate dehydrogenase [Bradyrhizobium sp. ORS 278]|uniref:NAD(P)-dependent oxidoreductase n=1 Tax=Bradyrhizobium sp. (strain ORS 278) TaxID=114615 RepID=UPI0001508E01|nr:NAD(P)-dependent oxidoreductase [Bradyrhizobium sp. ORS 278]CAL80211.1 putative 3-hydroxyisobutyrate dehydrogenase [Bradyrhizobium sp. ORS 278]
MTATHSLGWIGMGRMGYPMAERLLKAGHKVSIFNRTRAKAEPLATKGGIIVDHPSDLAGCDIVFSMVSTAKDLEQVYFGDHGLVASGSGPRPQILVDCSSIGVGQSEAIDAKLRQLDCAFVRAPVSGNGKCVKAGKLSSVVSGPKAAFDAIAPYLAKIAVSGVSYVGEGELARICKIAHNVFLGVVIQNLAEITILAQKAGVPRHAFLDFMNASVMGSTFTKYKSNALVNLDWTTTFTPTLLRKDLDLGLSAARQLDVAMPVTAATREALQAHVGAASLQSDPAAYLEKDFAALLETVALAAGLKLQPENVPMPTGLETEG